MRKPTRWILLCSSIVTVAALASAGWYLNRALPIGTGYTAKYLCSAVFVSQRDPQTVMRVDVEPVNILARIIDARVDRDAGSVTATALGLVSSTAIYRPGCGCTLLAGVTQAQLRSQPLPNRLPLAALPPERPWPEGDGPPGPLPDGVDEKRLQAALERAFGEPAGQGRGGRRTRAVVVVYDGRLVGERYAEGFDRHTALMGWSMSKSVTNALVGILVGQERLNLQNAAPISQWQAPGDPRGAITLDQMLRMSSGLDFEEKYAPLAGATRMLYASANFGAFAADHPSAASPDGAWYYSSGTTNIISSIIRATVGGTLSQVQQFARSELLEPLGMTTAVLEPDPSGSLVGSSYTLASARDWARFGQLYLQDGVWKDRRILPEGWVSYSTTPTPKAPQGKYGAHFWLNAGTPGRPKDRRWPLLPRDAFFAMGYQGQSVGIIPSRRAVVVRLGLTTDASTWDLESFVAQVLETLPETEGS